MEINLLGASREAQIVNESIFLNISSRNLQLVGGRRQTIIEAYQINTTVLADSNKSDVYIWAVYSDFIDLLLWEVKEDSDNIGDLEIYQGHRLITFSFSNIGKFTAFQVIC